MKRRPLVALSSAAVFAVYAAGYVRTRAAAERFAADAAPRRAPASNPPLVQAPPALPRVERGEPVIAPPATPRLEERRKVAPATIAKCLTRYSCSWIDSLLPQVSERQTAEVDWVSGATESSDAFHQALADALAKAK